MYKLLLFFAYFLVTITLAAQRQNFAIGLQAGNNSSRTIITTEFANSPLKSDFFIGSSFGVVARQKFVDYHWRWGGIREHIQTYVEYGMNVAYGGYNYRYAEQTTFQEQITYSIPVLLVFRPIRSNFWRKSYKGKRIYPIVKSGFNFTKNKSANIGKVYQFGEAVLQENVTVDGRIRPFFVGALGFQKEYKNGRILYLGVSWQSQLATRTRGQIILNSPQYNEIAQLAKIGNFYSIDLQYFIGKRTEKKSNRQKRGKLPKIIYNPRYF